MRKAAFLSASLAALAVRAGLSPAYADANEAMCEVRKDGETKHGQSGPCTFSQRRAISISTCVTARPTA